MQKRLFSPITISTIWNWTSIGMTSLLKRWFYLPLTFSLLFIKQFILC